MTPPPANALIHEPVTGQERCAPYGAPYAALVRFYRAFNGRDLALMRENWHAEGDIAMDNPLGGIKRGWREIGEMYGRLFGGPATVYVEFFDYSLHETPDMFYAVGRERGRFERGGASLDLAIRTSRIFRRTAEGWRQVHHHGSIEDPGLLARYQQAALGR